MKKFVCSICGYVHEGDTPPEKCPVCKADVTQSQRAQLHPSDGDTSTRPVRDPSRAVSPSRATERTPLLSQSSEGES